ncbi:hypothetical protein BU14_0171s0018 [Porphyra umbilicalis]|uniref:Uncharacterized protein n=1 Tax=Porphyra umbilicalis TaxID=2786 RepID=A0A1X6P7K6_PORUM|nr:hypothetical protein BU14_0171s0018 [Porphyra umbilicalis]|eukprot:OSX76869.1 hypothetical protein BU14_0171s0018 [Porphyra umbilicalis]
MAFVAAGAGLPLRTTAAGARPGASLGTRPGRQPAAAARRAAHRPTMALAGEPPATAAAAAATDAGATMPAPPPPPLPPRRGGARKRRRPRKRCPSSPSSAAPTLANPPSSTASPAPSARAPLSMMWSASRATARTAPPSGRACTTSSSTRAGWCLTTRRASSFCPKSARKRASPSTSRPRSLLSLTARPGGTPSTPTLCASSAKSTRACP